MRKEEKFDELYKKLNPAQKEAVDAVEGPVMVVAGPGTGKTQILTLRIANILRKTDAQPGNILALTFTESATVSMRRRLVDIIGGAAYSVVIGTFHGFCNDVIRNYPEEFPRIIGSQNITEIDQVRILESIINAMPLKELKPFGDPMYYLRSVLSNINTLKQEGVSVDAFKKTVTQERIEFDAHEEKFHVKGPHAGKMKGEFQRQEKQIKKNEELVMVYREYQKELARAKYYDWSDMIIEVYEALLRNSDLLLMLQEKHQYILVDEHQDTNNAQNKILELLANYYENPNIFVVGDEKQAIFRFQGASLENFLYFKEKYPDARMITLEENYRSTQSILDSAHSLIESEKRLKANASHDERNIMLFSFSRPEVEYFFLADHIAKRIQSGVHPHEIAVIYRDNRDVFPVAHVFEKHTIPFAIESDQNILEDIDIKKLLLLFRAVEHFGKDELLFEAMHIDFFAIDSVDIYTLIDYARKEKASALSLMRAPDILDAMGLVSLKEVKRFFANMSVWKSKSKNADIVTFFETVVRESGFLSHILSLPDSVEKMDKLIVLFDEVKSLAEVHRGMTLGKFIEYLDTLDAHNVSIKKGGARHVVSRVRCMTAHRAKGLEFEYVYIINAYDGHWGNKRKINSLPLVPRAFSLFGRSIDGNEIDDERRLFYVALTRAKKEICVSYARTDDGGKEKIPSQFLSELNSAHITEEKSDEYEDAYVSKKSEMFSESFSSGIDVRNKDFVRDVFMRNGLSVTGLNNYLDCPWKYFYMNLLRIPKAPEKHQMYGIAMHGALKDFFENLKKREVGSDYLLQRFEFYLNRQPLTPNDYSETLERGKKALAGYFETYAGRFHTRALTEFSIQGALLAPDIRLTGIIDKMEMLDETGKVNVVDYKTGKPKSRGTIEGATKSSDGGIKRQLLFYRLLLELYKEGGRFDMVSGDIDFVEPDEKGRYKKEHFDIVEEDVEELRQLILTVSKEILELSFWDRFCDEPKCEFCELRRMM